MGSISRLTERRGGASAAYGSDKISDRLECLGRLVKNRLAEGEFVTLLKSVGYLDNCILKKEKRGERLCLLVGFMVHWKRDLSKRSRFGNRSFSSQ